MSLLLVEDDERVSRFVARGLEAEGYSVVVACDGPQGFALARTQPHEIVILDVMLPGYSGKDVCQRLRANGVSTPILMLTALDAVEDKVDGLRNGADDYLSKPFDFDELLARIEALIRRSKHTATERARVLQAGEVTLDRDSMTACCAGRQVELTLKEFQLLELLMSSPGKAMSRTRILNKVWNYDSDPLTNIVDVYIRRLRTKLGADPDHGLIRTVRGYGYKLDPDVSSD
ncbi:MAG: response regulator transcription factor [Steroidobacteraceae bacterium]